ncbi:hypothetical protein OPU71_05320 [Niveibacterium sp. 24ML]|uniref:hypothetical protein n=1 Tax=Niveibacterium sp. 24ML TaxID=2985512 RepID=UPI0022721028|nr:hypothetical protein [Niveibacterium sp. 24ML]MCX9155542.1 hypothetical protein [Niveibacterium sp. 24ML]
MSTQTFEVGHRVRIGHLDANTAARQAYFNGRTGTLVRKNRIGGASREAMWYVRVDPDEACATLEALFYASELEPVA